MNAFFNDYSLRARFAPVVILFAPAIFAMNLYVEEVRTLLGAIIILITLLAIASYLSIAFRKCASATEKRVFANGMPSEILLFRSNEFIDEQSRLKYIDVLLRCTQVNVNSLEACKRASTWLRANYQNSPRAHIVNEENIAYGFCLMMLSIKKLGICICVLTEFTSCFLLKHAKIDLSVFIASSVFTLLCTCIWVRYVSKKTVQFAGNKYAVALLSCLDNICPTTDK